MSMSSISSSLYSLSRRRFSSWVGRAGEPRRGARAPESARSGIGRELHSSRTGRSCSNWARRKSSHRKALLPSSRAS